MPTTPQSSPNDDIATPSFSMRRALHERLKLRLPRYGQRSRLVARMIEMYLAGEIDVRLPAVPEQKI